MGYSSVIQGGPAFPVRAISNVVRPNTTYNRQRDEHPSSLRLHPPRPVRQELSKLSIQPLSGNIFNVPI
jgi:hypothetical protein